MKQTSGTDFKPKYFLILLLVLFFSITSLVSANAIDYDLQDRKCNKVGELIYTAKQTYLKCVSKANRSVWMRVGLPDPKNDPSGKFCKQYLSQTKFRNSWYSCGLKYDRGTAPWDSANNYLIWKKDDYTRFFTLVNADTSVCTRPEKSVCKLGANLNWRLDSFPTILQTKVSPPSPIGNNSGMSASKVKFNECMSIAVNRSDRMEYEDKTCWPILFPAKLDQNNSNDDKSTNKEPTTTRINSKKTTDSNKEKTKKAPSIKVDDCLTSLNRSNLAVGSKLPFEFFYYGGVAFQGNEWIRVKNPINCSIEIEISAQMECSIIKGGSNQSYTFSAYRNANLLPHQTSVFSPDWLGTLEKFRCNQSGGNLTNPIGNFFKGPSTKIVIYSISK